jgi:hypothetical protein
MTLHYRLSDPSDVRDLGDLIVTWVESGNPKADDWAEQPPAPAPDAIWRDDGAWVVPPPPEPEPDWGNFKRLALTHPGLNAAMAAALPLAPAAALALPAALMRAESGAVADFAGCWRAVCAAASMAPETVKELVSAAQAANLPAEFVAALEPAQQP